MRLLKYRQKDSWTCGPAVMKVVLAHFGINKEIEELIGELKTTKKQGTEHKNIEKLLKKYKLKFIQKKNATFEELKSALKDAPVIVDYWVPYHKESHYSLVIKINSQRIYFHDTYFGPNHSYMINYFLKNWEDQEAKGWLLAIKK